MDLENPTTWLTGGAGTFIAFLAYKFLWPVLSSSLNSAVSNARTGDQLMKQIVEERDRAVTRADAADARVVDLLKELYTLKNNVDMLTFQLKAANDKIDALTKRVEGGNHD